MQLFVVSDFERTLPVIIEKYALLLVLQSGSERIEVAVKTCKLDDEYETAEKFLEEARKSNHVSSLVLSISTCDGMWTCHDHPGTVWISDVNEPASLWNIHRKVRPDDLVLGIPAA